MDAFFASVEVLDDPSLAGQPVIVGGAGARGVVASCTYEARVFGVRSAMPSVRARQLCPQAIFLPGRHGRYAEISGQLHRILTDITPLMEPIGLDEAFLNVAGAVRMLGHPNAIAEGLRQRVRAELSLDCAVGIGRSKMIAKLASRAAKPKVSRAGLEPGPGVVLIEPEVELAFLHAHRVEALWGVGPATATRLHALGVRTVGDLAAIPVDSLVRRVGKASGQHLAALARGEDPSPVTPDRPAKSIGHEETFSQDLVDPTELERHVLRMAESVATMLRGSSSAARTVTVKVKFKDLSLQTRSSDRWPLPCSPGSTPERGSACSGSAPRGWSKAAETSCRSTWATVATRVRKARRPANSRGRTRPPRSTRYAASSVGPPWGRRPWSRTKGSGSRPVATHRGALRSSPPLQPVPVWVHARQAHRG
jgi:DNA polymerase-4